jgi:hypothetical protein
MNNKSPTHCAGLQVVDGIALASLNSSCRIHDSRGERWMIRGHAPFSVAHLAHQIHLVCFETIVDSSSAALSGAWSRIIFRHSHASSFNFADFSLAHPCKSATDILSGKQTGI